MKCESFDSIKERESGSEYRHECYASSEEDYNLPLKDRLINHLAGSNIILKSQQRYEPDLNLEERKHISKELIEKSPSQFLYRFGKYLKREHLQYFAELPCSPDLDHYLLETQKFMNHETRRTKIKNRRYAALKKLQSGNYFSEEEMQKRDPLLYDELIEKNLTTEEKTEKRKAKMCDQSFSGLLFDHMDQNSIKEKKKYQEELEHDAVEEYDEESDEEVEMNTQEILNTEEKELLKNEFYSSSYSHFLMGKDKEFDYSAIDESEDFDMLDFESRDEEERYFEED